MTKRRFLSIVVLLVVSAPCLAAPTLSDLFYQAADAFHRAEPKFHIYEDTPLELSPQRCAIICVRSIRNQ